MKITFTILELVGGLMRIGTTTKMDLSNIKRSAPWHVLNFKMFISYLAKMPFCSGSSRAPEK